MPRPILATLHPDALRANLQRCRAAMPDARVWAVVKANAYGHGIERVFDALRSADGLAMLDLAEAQRVRALGWRGPVLLLEGVFDPRDLELCARLDLWHTVHHTAQIDWLAQLKSPQPQRVMLKLNTGMNRLGFTPGAYRSAWARLNALPQVEDIVHMTHFANADQPGGMDAALACFDAVCADLPGARSLCNSAATLGGDAARLRSDWVRPGLALYGSAPDHPRHSSADWGLQPALSLASELIAVHALSTGDSVGYGAQFTAPAPMRVGVVACGYADGYPRVAPTGTPVLVHGVRTRTLGRVSMDMLCVDLEPVFAAGVQPAPGSPVLLWGRTPQGQVLPIDDVAAAAGTLGYELMCALAARVPVQVEGTA